MRPAHSAGFTLIELLVTVSIIAVLFTMTLSVVTLVRGAARSAACMSSLRQIGLAFGTYQNDNEGFVPPPYLNYVDASGNRVSDLFTAAGDMTKWFGALIGSLDDTRQKASTVWVCPQACFPKLTGGSVWGGSYGYNSAPAFLNWVQKETGGSGGNAGNFYTRGYLPERQPHPGSCILLAERWAADAAGVASPDWNVVPPYDGSGRLPQTSPLHLGGNGAALRISHRGRSNYLFLDYHCELLGPWDRIPAGTTAASESASKPNIWIGSL